jgi:hypothetical protein
MNMSLATQLKSVVEEVFDCRLLARTKSKNVVFARITFAKILRENKYTLKQIGDYVGKNHTTVIYYCSYDTNFNPELEKKIQMCKSIMESAKEHETVADKQEILSELVAIRSKYVGLLKDSENYERTIKRFGDIIKLLNARVPAGKERDAYRKINAMLNGGI